VAKAFTAADVDTIVSLYAPDAVFMGTVSKTIVTTPEDIRKYFQVALLGKRRFVASFVERSVTAVAETAFVVTARTSSLSQRMAILRKSLVG